MKSIKYISATAAVLLLTACSANEDAISDSYPSDGVVRITTNVNQVTSRNSETYSDYTGTSLGLGIIYDDVQTNPYNRPNVLWTKSSDVWTPASAMLWKNASTAAKVYAYVPYQENATDMTAVPFSVQTDQKTNGSASSDLLGYVNSNFVPGNDLKSETVPVELEHKCAQIIVKLTYDATAYAGIDAVNIQNVATSLKYNATTGECTDLSDVARVEMKSVTENSEYTAIIPAQKIAASTRFLGITTASSNLNSDVRTFGYVTASELTFNAGYSYTLNVTVGKDNIYLTSISLAPWVDTDLGSGEAKKDVVVNKATHTVTVNNVGSLTDKDITNALNGTKILRVQGCLNQNDMNALLINSKTVSVIDLRGVTSIVDGTGVNLSSKYNNTDCIFIMTEAQATSTGVDVTTWTEKFDGQVLYVGRNMDMKIDGKTAVKHTPDEGYVVQISDNLESYETLFNYTTSLSWDEAKEYCENYNTAASSRLIGYGSSEIDAIRKSTLLMNYLAQSIQINSVCFWTSTDPSSSSTFDSYILNKYASGYELGENVYTKGSYNSLLLQTFSIGD